MARNVFVSFLGTNNYPETYYDFQGDISPRPVRFIQEALVEILCGQWTQKDKILIFCTALSKKKNWIDNGQEDTEVEGLSSRLKRMNLPVQTEMVEIKEGFSEEDIWSIFNSVYDELEKDDNIIFDVTHAFRSIPMFSAILFNYAHYLKGTNLKAVYYGAFEKLGPTYEVSRIPVENRIAPIIDLTSIICLQELSSAANNLHLYGKMTAVSNLISIVKGKGKDQQEMDRIKKKMMGFDLAISTCKMDDIKHGELIHELQTLVESVKESKHLTNAHKKLIVKVQTEISVFKPYDTYENVEAAIHWARKYGMIQQAYTLAEEMTISRVQDLIVPGCKLLQREKNKTCREFISVLLSLDIKMKEYKNERIELKKLFYQLLEHPVIKALRPYYGGLSGDRNIINHAKKSDKDLIAQFDKNYHNIKEILSNVPQPL